MSDDIPDDDDTEDPPLPEYFHVFIREVQALCDKHNLELHSYSNNGLVIQPPGWNTDSPTFSCRSICAKVIV